MDPKDPQHVIPQALQDAISDPARRDQTVTVDGTDFRLQFDPEPGVDRRVTSPQMPGGMPSTTYVAADERAASYPPELPFLPGLAVSVQEFPEGMAGGASATWWQVAGVEGAVAKLRAQSTADGWLEGAETVLAVIPGFPALRILNFERAKGERRLIHVSPTGSGNTVISVMHPAD
jgi:hypothetical protein